MAVTSPTNREPGEQPSAPAQSGGGEQGLDRLVFFSDAVIAIALTLLALDLNAPTGNTDAQRWHSLVDQFSDQYFPFLLSFAVIAAYWASHHRFFQRVARLGPNLVPLNMLFLFMIVVLPFATRTLAEGGRYQVSVVLYAAVVAGVGLSLLLLVWQVRRHGLLRPAASPPVDMIRSLLVTSAAFLVSIPIVFVDTDLAKYSWLVLTVPVALVTRLVRFVRRMRRGPAA